LTFAGYGILVSFFPTKEPKDYLTVCYPLDDVNPAALVVVRLSALVVADDSLLSRCWRRALLLSEPIYKF